MYSSLAGQGIRTGVVTSTNPAPSNHARTARSTEARNARRWDSDEAMAVDSLCKSKASAQARRAGSRHGRGGVARQSPGWDSTERSARPLTGWACRGNLVFMNKPVSMNQPVSIGAFQAKTELSRLLRAARAGKRFIITQRGVPVAELIPVQRNPPGSAWGDMAGQITMSDDFDAPLEDFADYME